MLFKKAGRRFGKFSVRKIRAMNFRMEIGKGPYFHQGVPVANITDRRKLAHKNGRFFDLALSATFLVRGIISPGLSRRGVTLRNMRLDRLRDRNTISVHAPAAQHVRRGAEHRYGYEYR